MGQRSGTKRAEGLTVRTVASYVVVAAGVVLAIVQRENGAAALLLGLLVGAVGLGIQLPLRRIGAFLGPFGAYALLWAGFTIIRGACGKAPWADETKYWTPDLERWLFGRLPSAALQDRFFILGDPNWYDYALGVVYYSFFVVPLVLAIVLIARHREAFWYHFRGLTALKLSALAIYFLLPTAPPWMAGGQDGKIERIAELIGLNHGATTATPSSAGDASLMSDPNPIAAMPSVHMGLICVLALTAWRFGNRWLRVLGVAYALSMGLSLVYLGEHYVLDIAAGAAVAIVTCVYVNSVSLRDLVRWPGRNAQPRRSHEWQRETGTAIPVAEAAD
jgi:hypothetical protein